MKRTRAEHRIRNGSQCLRCDLLKYYGDGRCPPGFWMTETEIDQWQEADDETRHEMELSLGAQLERVGSQPEVSK